MSFASHLNIKYVHIQCAFDKVLGTHYSSVFGVSCMSVIEGYKLNRCVYQMHGP